MLCPADLSCGFDALSDSIAASWTAAEGLLDIRIFKDGLLAHTLPPDATFTSVSLEPADFGRDVIVTLEGTAPDGINACSIGCTVTVPPAIAQFVRGDCNADGMVSMDFQDINFIDLVLQGLEIPLCASACDANDDGFLEPGDALFLTEFIFGGGPPLPAPYPACGADETPDGLECASYPFCE